MASVTPRRIILPYRFGARGMRVDGVLAVAAGLLLAITAWSLWRGRAALGQIDWPIAIHLMTLLPALALTPFLFLGTKGATAHRRIGYTWCALMVATAIASLFIRSINPSGFSAIHVFSVMTLVSTPRLISNARKHRWKPHRYVAIGLTSGGLLVAGVTAYMGDRHLANWIAS